MKFKLFDMDLGPNDLQDQLPIKVTLIKEYFNSSSESDGWLAKCANPIKYGDLQIDFVVIKPRFVGVTIKSAKRICFGVAFVTDNSMIKENSIDITKSEYVAIIDARRCLF